MSSNGSFIQSTRLLWLFVPKRHASVIKTHLVGLTLRESNVFTTQTHHSIKEADNTLNLHTNIRFEDVYRKLGRPFSLLQHYILINKKPLTYFYLFLLQPYL